MNVLDDDAAMQRLQRMGARSVPVVARGNDYVYAQVISDVVQFLGLDDDSRPKLSPAILIERFDTILSKAIVLVRSMPDKDLENMLPNRPRSWRVLMHHVFQIPVAYLDSEATGEPLTYENLVAPPPAAFTRSAQIADFGEQVHARFVAWGASVANESFDGRVAAYFGDTSRHEMLERTVWHSTQHVRQVAALLAMAGCNPEPAVTAADIDGLPLTNVIWDEA